jgi:hypothetical protein
MIEPAQRIVIKILRPRRRRQLVEAVGGIAAEVYITPTSSVSTIAILTQPYLRKI